MHLLWQLPVLQVPCLLELNHVIVIHGGVINILPINLAMSRGASSTIVASNTATWLSKRPLGMCPKAIIATLTLSFKKFTTDRERLSSIIAAQWLYVL